EKGTLSEVEYSRMTTEIDQYEQAMKKNPDDPMAEAKLIAVMEALIDHSIQEYDHRANLKHQITPNTKRTEYAAYYKEVQKKIEKIGTCHFPRKDGKKLYGKVIVYIPISSDGNIYREDGGPRIERSSGDADLDAASLKIIEMAAPFSPFTKTD